MKKEDFQALTPEQKQELKSWIEEDSKSVEDETNNEEQKDDQSSDTQKEVVEEEEKVAKSEDETNTVEKKEETTKTYPEFEQRIKEMQENYDKQIKTLSEIAEKAAKDNESLSKRLVEIEKKNPFGNYNPKPNDEKTDNKGNTADKFAEAYRNQYKK